MNDQSNIAIIKYLSQLIQQKANYKIFFMKQLNQQHNSVNTVIHQQTKTDIQLQQLVTKIYKVYYQQISFHEIDYLVGQPQQYEILNCSANKELKKIVGIVDGCLVFTEIGFDLLYYYLLRTLQNEKVQWQYRNMVADLLVTLNGENSQVYNFKKTALIAMNSQKQQAMQRQQISSTIPNSKQLLNIQKELKLNEAIIMKNKKTSSCYDYRYWLIQFCVEQEQSKQHTNIGQFITNIHEHQHKILKKILQRFPRNYFCWMYRLRIYKLFTRSIDNSFILFQQISMIQSFLELNPNDYSILSYYRFLLKNCYEKQFEKQTLKKIKQNNDKLIEFCKIAYESTDHYRYLIKFVEEVNARNKLMEDNCT